MYTCYVIAVIHLRVNYGSSHLNPLKPTVAIWVQL